MDVWNEAVLLHRVRYWSGDAACGDAKYKAHAAAGLPGKNYLVREGRSSWSGRSHDGNGRLKRSRFGQVSDRASADPV